MPSDLLSLATQSDQLSENALVTNIDFDAIPKSNTVTTPLGRQTSTVLDAQGRVVMVSEAGVDPVVFTYSQQGQLVTTSQGARSTALSYDSSGNLATTTNALQETTSFAYDLAGRVTAITRADTTQVLLGYDASGNVTTITPPSRPPHLFSYSGVDLLETYTAPDVGFGPAITAYGYNADRQLTSVLFPDGALATLSYTALGKLASAAFPGGTMQFGYDTGTGQLTSVTGPYGVDLAYNYDGSLLTDTTWSGAVSGSVHRDYDSFFRLAAEGVNSEPLVAFGYDDDGLMTQAGDMLLSYDPASSRLDGTALQGVTDSFTYNSFGEVVGYTAQFGSTVLFDVVYVRDDLGRIVQKTETIEGQTDVYAYGYDAVGQLVSVSENGQLVREYVYDGNGNRIQMIEGSNITNGVYDDQDRLLSYGDLVYSYNQRGQLVSETDSLHSATTNYTYDVLGNLRQVTLPGSTYIEYVVDGFGRRVGKKVDGALVKQWLYGSGSQLVAELDGAGNVQTRFVWAGELARSPSDPAAVLLARLGLPPDLLSVSAGLPRGQLSRSPLYMLHNGDVYRFVTDELGSPRLIVDVATGTVVERIDYDEWGEPTMGATGFIPHGFRGGLHDPDTRLVRFGARDYSAQIGRWTTWDPVARLTALNRYAYVGNDPINELDASGYGPVDCNELRYDLTTACTLTCEIVLPLGLEQYPIKFLPFQDQVIRHFYPSQECLSTCDAIVTNSLKEAGCFEPDETACVGP